VGWPPFYTPKPCNTHLGDIVLKDKERVQPRAGRLDLLLQDAESYQRYEVEIQLGKTDEAHIIRTIEYWDIERKRYPQYEHTAVIVAEDITSRFLNVINLFNGAVPLIAIQMNALKIEDKISLFCATVLNEMPLGYVDEDEETQEVTDRSYWENRDDTKNTLPMADEILSIFQAWDPQLNYKYNKSYIVPEKNGRTQNFVMVVPQKKRLQLRPRLERSQELESEADSTDLDLTYDAKAGRYLVRLAKGDIKRHEILLNNLLEQAIDVSNI
jgi:predicted transport protein